MKTSSKIRIAMCGPSGTGKTTLAKKLAYHYGVEFRTTSTKQLWREFGVKSHKEIVDRTAADPDGFGFEFQLAVINLRRGIFMEPGNFVTDRSPIDIIAYAVNDLAAHLSEPKMQRVIQEANNLMNDITLFYLPHGPWVDMENDGIRISSGYYQYKMNALFNMAFERWVIPVHPFFVLDFWHLGHRMKAATQYQNNNKLGARLYRWLGRHYDR